MGKNYCQLSLRERVEIEILHRAGRSMRAIGLALGRSAGTISRELARNAQATKQWRGRYEGERAERLAQRRRRWDARYKLMRQPDLQAKVRDDNRLRGMTTEPRGCHSRAGGKVESRLKCNRFDEV